ncbi:putative cell adhesion molecule 2-like [Penaeus vannamei]|uniref:Putative cell adhesion molecule 2-like n=1 Tax=Penaeus vannamei TaxID=6689 RepID=A0A423TJN4_PENVA|nr:putative cell adhesion molecule 2-like [Penaeus vannamei]
MKPKATVTWTKSDEELLLTVGERIYTSEPRYFISHVRHRKLWELSIRDVRAADAGAYECQVASHPLAALFFLLRVVEARAVVPDGAALHSRAGVRLRIQCRVDLATEPVSHFFWYHNGTAINFSKTRSLTVVTHDYCSYVVIENVTWADSGVYTCAPLRARPANLTLHVLQDEQRSALHKGRAHGDSARAVASVLSPAPPAWLLVACLVGARPSC